MKIHDIIGEQGKLYWHPEAQQNMVGFWFNPKTGEHHELAWGLKPNEDEDFHHADMVANFPERFGLPRNKNFFKQFSDSEEIRLHVMKRGWVRITITEIDASSKGLIASIDGFDPIGVRRATLWVTKHYPAILMVRLSLYKNNQFTHYQFDDDSLETYLKSGRLI